LDLLTLQPLGGVDVTLKSTNERGIRIVGVGDSNSDGRYVFCGVPPWSGLNVTAEFMAETSRTILIPDTPSDEVPPIYLRWSRPADIIGRVFDGATGEPLEAVLVELVGRPVRSLTDNEGTFRFPGQGAGRFIVRSSRIGYMTRTDSVDVASADRLDFEITLFEEAVGLAPIVVRVRSDLESQRRGPATRRDMLTQTQVDSLLPRVTDMVSLLRAGGFAGVEIEYRGGGGLCVEITRGARGCNSVLLFVNGVRMDIGTLADILPESVATLQFLDPFEARIRFGGPGIQNGVLTITLR